MTSKTSKNIDIKLLVALAAIALTIFSAAYYISHREITDANVLSLRVIDALEDTSSYRFNISTNLAIPEGEVKMISGKGSVDYRNKKLRTTMTMMNNSVEMVVIGDTAYLRESNGTWQTQNLSGYSGSIWESSYDQLAQQRSILLNATNVTMQREDNGWILNIIPDKEDVVEQMRKTGIETIKQEELKNFTIRYWIEKDTYWITKVENQVELEMNIQGLVTPLKLNSASYLDNYNEKMEIEAPI
jgi:hypothetical protein